MKIKVSIVMSVCNGEQYIGRCLRSIAKQTFNDYEVLVMDDGSTDTTGVVVSQFAGKDPRVRGYHQQNAGLAAALNALLAVAQGEYIARMDVDDLITPERLALQVQFLDNHRDVDLVTCGVAHFSETGKLVFARVSSDISNENDEVILQGRGNPLTHGSVVFRKSSISQFQLPYRTRYGQDYDLWIRCLASGWKFATIPEVLYYYQKGSSLQEDPLKNAIREAQMKAAVQLRYEGRLFDDRYCLMKYAEVNEMVKKRFEEKKRYLFSIKRFLYHFFMENFDRIVPRLFRRMVYDGLFHARGRGYLRYSDLHKLRKPSELY